MSALIILLMSAAFAGNSTIDNQDTSFVNVTAFFDESLKAASTLERIADFFYKDLEQRSKKYPVNVTIITDDADDNAINNSGLYIVKFELIKSSWRVDRPMFLPYIIYVYRKTFRIEAIAKIYRKDEAKPVYVKHFKTKIIGPGVTQFIDKDPHAGSLMLTYTSQIEFENKAERKIGVKLSKELLKTIKKYGGI